MNWFWKFVSRLLNKRAGHFLWNLGGERCARERQPVRLLFFWTREEAETAWLANRIEVNLALTLPENVTAVRSRVGVFIVDGKPANVVIYISESAKAVDSFDTGHTRKEAKEERQKVWEKQWLENGCVKDSSGNWTVPDELIYRSLPRGEDR